MSDTTLERTTALRARTGVFLAFAIAGFAFASWASRLPDVKRLLGTEGSR